MKNGTVKYWNDARGFGFLTDENGTDYFVGHRQIQGEGFKTLRNGEAVTFEVGTDRTGRPCAVSVQRLDPNSQTDDTWPDTSDFGQ